MSNEPQQLYIVTQLRSFASNDAIRETVSDWLTLCQILVRPQKYYIDDDTELLDFDRGLIKERINALEINQQGDTLFSLKATEGEFSIHIYQGHVRERLLINEELYQNFKPVIDDYINTRMEKNGLYAYIRSIDEFLAHNTQSMSDRLEEEISSPDDLPKMYDDQQKIIVDCSQLPGYDSYFKGLCFTACWKMWYAPDYYYVIPKQAFLDVQQVEAVVTSHDVIQVTLYEDPLAWEHPSNLKFQFAYRDQLGFDQLEWSNGVGVLREPCTEFIKIGANTQMIQYQNESLQPTTKSTARHFTTRVFNYDNHHYLEGRRFGTLNNRAYFPWRDATKKIMLAYWILNPSYMLDEGIHAFEFYIKQYIKAAVSDEETKNYRAVLRFYMPEEAITSLSIDNLVQYLDTHHINVKKRNAKKHLLQIETADVDLHVEFVDVKQLESPEEVTKSQPLESARSWFKERLGRLN